ncbi:MAG: uracil-DNA glycosylase [Victivallaceae bacterium]|nr:uracil-DNA glycosylase [Victivallaceae bacterium]
MNLAEQLPEAWLEPLTERLKPETLPRIAAFLAAEQAAGHRVFPPESRRFAAMEEVPPERVRVVILGQDPYHDDGQAHGLAFSVPDGVKPPPSLRNIFRELADDVACPEPSGGNLSSWAEQGVLMLNTVLSVRAHEPNSHRDCGWLDFTDAAIRAIAAMPQPKVFILWGAPAQTKRRWVDESRDAVIASAHPSPLSAYRGFFGSRPFSRANAFLRSRGAPEIDWNPERSLF